MANNIEDVLRLGETGISKLKYGTSGIVAAYLGAEKLWEEAPPEPTDKEAIFSFTTSSVAQSPVNRVLYSEGLANGLDIDGIVLTWGIEYVSGTPYRGTFIHPSVATYEGLPWPYNPVVDPQGDYVIQSINGLGDGDVVLDVIGLEAGRNYELRFTGSTPSGGAVVSITIDGENKSVVLSATDKGRDVVFESITPDSEGKIRFQMRRSNTFNYVSAVYIKEL